MTIFELRTRQLESTSQEELESLIDQELVIEKQIRLAEVLIERYRLNHI
jgi:hypothetical protein